NLPNEASVEDIRDCYELSWQLGIKACALYRDGSKLSQPLSNKSDKKAKASTDENTVQAKNSVNLGEASHIIDLGALTIDELLDEVNKRVQDAPDTKLKSKLAKIVERKNLPAKRRGYTFKGKVGGQPLFLRTGEYTDGTIGEIFIDMAKEGATMRSLMNSFAIAVSVGLQYGVPLEEYVDKFIFTRFEPSGIVDHPNIKTATSVLDYIFRVLAYEYLDRDDLVHVVDPTRAGSPSSSEERELSNVRVAPALPKGTTEAERNAAQAALHNVKLNGKTLDMTKPSISTHDATHMAGSLAEARSDVKKMMGTSADAPACSNCGNITLRNGTCYMCPNCGTTTGCS
ncbi:MAG: vitamin B12-dependent ribonucleotide reductase, partial [Bacteroidetes bacterium]|nr:vitamin B12-dependent ribonucleotide reductase [Bacteroidota bacterium]